jgi:hypothetical protein
MCGENTFGHSGPCFNCTIQVSHLMYTPQSKYCQSVCPGGQQLLGSLGNEQIVTIPKLDLILERLDRIEKLLNEKKD